MEWMEAGDFYVYDAWEKVTYCVGRSEGGVKGLIERKTSGEGRKKGGYVGGEGGFRGRSRTEYTGSVGRIKEEIRRGNTYEVCLTNKRTWRGSVDPHLVYDVLRRRNPSPYAAFLKGEEYSLCCSSPERFLFMEDGWVESKPIKGTIARGADEEEDGRNKHKLMTSVKDRAENLM